MTHNLSYKMSEVQVDLSIIMLLETWLTMQMLEYYYF